MCRPELACKDTCTDFRCQLQEFIIMCIEINLDLWILIECSNSSRCLKDRFCNFEDGETGYCASCPETDQVCNNQTFLSERAIQECQDICEGKP